jgi:hypothetical protein
MTHKGYGIEAGLDCAPKDVARWFSMKPPINLSNILKENAIFRREQGRATRLARVYSGGDVTRPESSGNVLLMNWLEELEKERPRIQTNSC